MTMNKDASSRPKEISNQVAEGKEKQVEGGRKRTKVICWIFAFSFLIPLLQRHVGALRGDLKGEGMGEET